MKILLPTDFSNNSLKAIFYTMELMGAGQQWILLNCFRSPHSGARVTIKINDIMAERSKQDLDALEKKIRERFNTDEFPIQIVSEHDEVLQCIDVMVEHNNLDLVALGTKGATGLKQVFMGSFSAKVVEHAKVPVLAIPDQAKYNNLNKLAIADDEEVVENSASVHLLRSLIEMHHPELLLVNVSDTSGDTYQPSKDGIDGLLANYERSHHNVQHNDIAKGLKQFNNENNIDMLVMLHRRGSAFMEWLTTSTSEEMAMHARVPLLVLKA